MANFGAGTTENARRLLIKMEFSVEFDFRMEGSKIQRENRWIQQSNVLEDVRNAIVLNVFNSNSILISNYAGLFRFTIVLPLSRSDSRNIHCGHICAYAS